MKVFTVGDMVSAEKRADGVGHSYATMMELAGIGLADSIIQRIDVVDKNILVLVGAGNNGGDGLVAGRTLAKAGAKVAIYLTKKRSAYTDANFALVQQMGLFIITRDYEEDFKQLRTRLRISDIIIDAVLGTGVSRPISSNLADLFRTLHKGLGFRRDKLYQRSTLTSLQPNSVHHSNDTPFIVAVDCPSGLHCDTGDIDPLALTADLTVTFAGPKKGHFMQPGAAACGEIVVVDIGISPTLSSHLVVDVATPAGVAAALPKRPSDGHKGTFGTVMIAAGSADYLGAPLLCGQGAYRAGCGLVALAVPQTVRQTAAQRLPEATFPPMPDVDVLGMNSAETILNNLGKIKVLLVGPGLSPHAVDFVLRLLSADAIPPLVLDADALNVLAAQNKWWKLLPHGTIITPHPGEMARLVGEDIREKDRVQLALDSAEKWQTTLVLKGAHTIIASPDRTATIIPIATPLLGVAGSGDILAGVIASLRAQGTSPFDAAVVGAYLHAAAGLQLSQKLGDAGLLAHEIADAIPSVRKSLLSFIAS